MLLEDIESGAEKLLTDWDGYVVYARGRQIPGTESYNVTFWKSDTAKLKEMTEKYEESCSLTHSQGGITLRYTEGTNVQRLTEIKRNNNMNYVELQFI